tara:strand:+ start:5618 stop:7420 length:1803 start_codon:yes stop_codon:yes gene_type:complete
VSKEAVTQPIYTFSGTRAQWRQTFAGTMSMEKYEDKDTVPPIKRDLPVTRFVGTQDEARNFCQDWHNYTSDHIYLQGDMDGGAFANGNMTDYFVHNQDNFSEEEKIGVNIHIAEIRFAFRHDGHNYGFVVRARKANPEDWMISFNQDLHKNDGTITTYFSSNLFKHFLLERESRQPIQNIPKVNQLSTFKLEHLKDVLSKIPDQQLVELIKKIFQSSAQNSQLDAQAIEKASKYLEDKNSLISRTIIEDVFPSESTSQNAPSSGAEAPAQIEAPPAINDLLDKLKLPENFLTHKINNNYQQIGTICKKALAEALPAEKEALQQSIEQYLKLVIKFVMPLKQLGKVEVGLAVIANFFPNNEFVQQIGEKLKLEPVKLTDKFNELKKGDDDKAKFFQDIDTRCQARINNKFGEAQHSEIARVNEYKARIVIATHGLTDFNAIKKAVFLANIEMKLAAFKERLPKHRKDENFEQHIKNYKNQIIDATNLYFNVKTGDEKFELKPHETMDDVNSQQFKENIQDATNKFIKATNIHKDKSMVGTIGRLLAAAIMNTAAALSLGYMHRQNKKLTGHSSFYTRTNSVDKARLLSREIEESVKPKAGA